MSGKRIIAGLRWEAATVVEARTVERIAAWLRSKAETPLPRFSESKLRSTETALVSTAFAMGMNEAFAEAADAIERGEHAREGEE